MLSNQVTTRDLFSYPLRQNSQDSSSQNSSEYLHSESGFQDSQSQSCNGSFSQTDIYSPGRSMFQKYSSRGSIFKPEGTLSTNQQDFQQSKAREREDREFMQNMMSIISESSSAVRFALESFRDSLETKQGKSAENMATSFQTREIQYSAEKIITAICEQDKVRHELHQLELKLSEKDAVISGLKNQLKEYQDNDKEKILEIVKDCHTQQQDMIEDKLQKLLSVTSEQLKVYDKQTSWQSDQEKNHADTQRKMLNEQQNHLKNLGDKLLSELSNVQDELSMKQSQMGNYYRQQLQEYHCQQVKAVESCLQKAMVESVKKTSRETYSLISQQGQDIESTCSRHKIELQRFMKSELTKQMFAYEQNVRRIASSLKALGSKQIDKTEDAILATQKNPSVMNSSKRTWTTLPLRSPKPKPMGDDDVENSEFGCDVETIPVSSPGFHISPYSYREQGVPPSTDFLDSPWDPNMLFQKSRTVKPSPVAKVAPIVQQSVSSNMSKHPTGTKITVNEKQGKENLKRQQGIVHPQRQSKRIKDLQKFSTTIEFPSESTSRYLTRSFKRQQGSMYNKEKVYGERRYGHDEAEELERKIQENQRKTSEWDKNEPQWLKVARLKKNCSPNTLMPMKETSPPMTTVEMVMKRKVRSRRTPNFVTEISRTEWSRTSLESDKKRTFDDLLSSPCFKCCDTLNEPSEERSLVLGGKVSRKKANKRKLCDVNYDTQITEITQAIKRQMQGANNPCL